MIGKLSSIIAWFVKNVGLVVGIVEQVLKVAGGIVSLTPTRKDDELVQKIEDWFGKIQGWLYKAADVLKKFGSS